MNCFSERFDSRTALYLKPFAMYHRMQYRALLSPRKRKHCQTYAMSLISFSFHLSMSCVSRVRQFTFQHWLACIHFNFEVSGRCKCPALSLNLCRSVLHQPCAYQNAFCSSHYWFISARRGSKYNPVGA